MAKDIKSPPPKSTTMAEVRKGGRQRVQSGEFDLERDLKDKPKGWGDRSIVGGRKPMLTSRR